MLAPCQSCGSDLPPGARFCPHCGRPVVSAASAAAKKRDLDSLPTLHRAERKLMTVLSADFQGFTAFAAKRDVEEVHEFINFYWKQLAPLIESHRGYVEKYIGDAFVALFGTEQTHEQDPAGAVRAALAVQACLHQLEASGHQPILPMRIGIHTGLVVIQSDSTGGGFTATGDAVNVTDRLQKLAPPGQVLISQDTFRHIAGLFDVQPPRPYLIEGKAEPILARVVVRSRPRVSARLDRGIEGVVTRMLGRDLELARFQTVLVNTIDRQEAHVVTVSGEAGLGKSRLLREFLKWVELLPESVSVFCSRATAEMSGSPFALWRDLLATQFDIQDTDTAGVAREKLKTGVTSLLARPSAEPGQGESPAEAVAHFMGHLAGLDFSASPHLQAYMADTQQFHRRAFESAGRFFTEVCRGPAKASGPATRRALVLVADDFHWSDEASISLVEHLATACRGAPLLIVCLTRPEFFERQAGWGEKFRLHTLIRLVPLAGPESRSLVEQILSPAGEIPPELSERIIGAAEGNPFYIEEIIKMLIERGGTRAGVGAWRFEPLRVADVMLPPTLTGVLQARLDALQPHERIVAQRASVLGRVFWDAALQHLQAPGEDSAPDRATDHPILNSSQISDALAGLTRKQIICRHQGSSQVGAVEYSFSHDLLRSVAYEGLLKKSRQWLHERAASWLICQGGERVAESASVIAHHLEIAGRTTESAEWYGKAGKQAAASHIPAMASESYAKALELSSVVGNDAKMSNKRLDWFGGVAEALGALADFDRAREAYLHMRDAAAAAGATVEEARSWNGLAFLHERQGGNLESIEAANRAIELSRRGGLAGCSEQLRALYLKGWAYYRLADAEQVLSLAEQSAELASQLGDRAAMARGFKLHGVAHLQLSHYDEADRYFQKGLELAQETGDLRTAAAMWSNRGETARARGDFESAVALYEKAIAISREIGARESELIYLVNLSAARVGLSQFAQAEADLRALIAPVATAQSFDLSEIYAQLSEACREQGNLVEALESARRALELAKATGNSLLIAEAWRTLGRALTSVPSAVGNCLPCPDDPDSCFQESLRLYQLIGARGEKARTLRLWAEFDLTRQRGEEARRKLTEARSSFMELEMAGDLDKATRLLKPIS
jgi:class 3 adenylate cyclase/tetratricopeptide (TPR) repeat protein